METFYIEYILKKNTDICSIYRFDGRLETLLYLFYNEDANYRIIYKHGLPIARQAIYLGV